jgi:hypothetical protein
MRFLLHLLLVFFLLAGVVWTAYQADQERPKETLQEYLYISKHEQLRKFAFGFEGEYADFLWIGSLQGFSKHCLDKVPFKNIDQVYENITDLDTHFAEAYRTGALYVAIVYKSSQRGIKVLENGTRKVPDKPWIWELLGRMYWLERFLLEKRKEMSKEEATWHAIEAIKQAVALGGGEEAELLLNFLVLRDRIADFDELMWLDFYTHAGKNSMIKAIALQRLQLQIARRHLEFLRKHLHEYRQLHQTWPASLQDIPAPVPLEPHSKDMEQLAGELVALVQQQKQQPLAAVQQYLLNGIKQLANSRPYFYDPATGEVSAFCLDEQKIGEILGYVQKAIDRFCAQYQRYPANLEELRLSSIMPKHELPVLPLAKKYGYRPTDGAVWAED